MDLIEEILLYGKRHRLIGHAHARAIARAIARKQVTARRNQRIAKLIRSGMARPFPEQRQLCGGFTEAYVKQMRDNA